VTLEWKPPDGNSDGTPFGSHPGDAVASYEVLCGPNENGPLPVLAVVGPDVTAFEVMPEDLLYCTVRAVNELGFPGSTAPEVIVGGATAP